MEVRAGSFSFSPARTIGPRTERATFNFTKTVRQAVAGLTGTQFGFSPREDHHLGQVNIRLTTTIDDDVVTVEGTFGVRDWSNNFDDDYDGTIQFILLAELETVSVPSNLSITGIEYNQAIQFFRSRLDPATARPDNSIGMIAMKDTILRVYIDTQTDPTRPTISMISGLLEIRLPGGSTWNAVTLLNGPIPPKQDSAINRGNANDTLNFSIPSAFCTGNVDFRIRVFDSAHPNQPGYTSGQIQNTLRFTRVVPLRVRGVGVHYTGLGLNIPAPNLADLQSTLSFVSKAYPTGQIFFTGFDVIDYDGDFQDQSGNGCGTGWDGLLSILREMQGDSDDVYFGLVPVGVPLGWGGCGGGDGKVAAGPVSASSRTAAMEIAHAFERDHAPPPTSCGNAGNVDPNYPVYDALPSGSIGEFGIDSPGSVLDPASNFDFMSYCRPRWVSPYTYNALSQKFPVQFQTIEEPTEQMSVPSQHLFLEFRIYIGGKIKVFPSFHYMSLPTIKSGRWTPYAIELRDSHNKALHSQRVWSTDPHKDLDSAFLDFYKPILFSEDTARIVFTCSGPEDCERKELLSIDVPRDSPKVRIIFPNKDKKELSGKIRVKWKAQYHDNRLNYLLRYSNDGGSTWRAIAPRLHVTEYIVNLDLLPGGERCQFQVLATEGIRTGEAVSVYFSVARHPCRTMIIKSEIPNILTVGQKLTFLGLSFSPDTGSLHPSELRWDSDVEGPLGSGSEINNINLRPSLHKISLRAPDALGGESVDSIQIEVKVPNST
jgi:hypothetical protein